MRGLLYRFIFLVGCLLLLSPSSHATHLMGGTMAYEYIADLGGGLHRYKIIFRSYTNCDSTSNFQNGPENSITIGIYNETVNPNDDKPRYLVVTMPLVDTTRITPNTTDSCSIGQGICIHEGVYEIEVDLEVMPNNQFSEGYHIWYDRCCRNFSISNLLAPGTQGMGFHAFIPPPVIENSSPYFTDLPLPFICVNDTVGILNTAVDPDGDQLVFSFVDPYRGYSSTGNPAPPPPTTLLWPIPTVNWLNVNYNKNDPFGPGGYAYINSSTGYTRYSSPNTGNYVIAVEIREYRNNNLIGISRRDMQLLVISCPQNDEPVFDYFTQQPEYQVEEGDSICFNIEFYDIEGDSVWLTAQGIIFDTNFVNPAAVIDTDQVGDSVVTALFCWNTACGQGRLLPYLFTVSVTDDGCPPKTTPIVVSVEVIPFEGPDSIHGPQFVCENDTAFYWVDTIGGDSHNWTVTGGAIISGQGTDTIMVAWGPGPNGTVEVTTTSRFGCPAGPITLAVLIQSFSADAGPDTLICLGDSVQIGGSPTGPNGTVFLWTPSTGLDYDTVANPWANPTTTTMYIVQVSDSFCSAWDTVIVTVAMSNVDAGPDTGFCAGDSVQLNATGGTSYQWSPSTGLSNDTIANPWASPSTTTLYYVTITDTNNCQGIDSVLVSVYANPVVDAGPDTAICLGESVIIGGSPTGPQGSTYDWQPSGSLNDNTLANPIATPAVTTTYIVNVTDSNGCTGSDTMTVTVNPGPTANIIPSPDTIICLGDTVPLLATGGITYDWSPSAGLSSTTIANPNAFPNTTTTYIVTVTDVNGCTDTDTVTIIVSDPPVEAGPDQTICLGDSVQLNGSGGVTYSWSPTTGLSNPNIANPWASPTTTTTYYLTVIDSIGCTAVDSVTIFVNPLPIVDAGPDQVICNGDSVQIGGSPTGPQGSTYLWTPSAGLDNTTIANPNAFPSTTTMYYVSVTDTNGCTNIDSCQVSVNASPIVDAGANDTICIGDSTQLNASGGITYSWSPTTGLSNPNIANPWASPTTTTTYIVTVTDGNNCTAIDSVTIFVNPLPNVDAGPDVWVCPGDSVQLNGTGPNGATYSWTPTTGLSNANIANPMVSVTDTTVYYLTVTDTNGCQNIDSVTVYANAVVPTDAGPDTTICEGDSVKIGGNPTSPNGTSFLWTPGGSLDNDTLANPWASPTTTTTYIVYSTNDTCSGTDTVTVFVNPAPLADAGPDTSFCIGDSVQLQATGGISYTWWPNINISDTTISNPWVNPNGTMTYYVEVTDGNGCTAIDSIVVTVNALPVVDAGADVSICPGDSTQLNASGGTTYSWTPTTGLSNPNIANPWANPTVTTTYYVDVTDGNGCTNTDSVTVIIFAAPIIDAGPDTAICLGDSIQLQASGGATYIWWPSTGLDDTTISNPWARPTATITYFVSVTDTNGCSDIDSITVFVNPLPVVDAGPDLEMCVGDSVQLQASGANTYVWTPANSLSNNTIANPWAYPSSTTTYYVTGTDGNECSNFDSMTVIVHPLPFADAGPDTNICRGAPVVIGGNPTGPQGSTYLWSPSGSLDNVNLANPTASPTTTMTYIVQVTDTNGCINTDSITVNIFAITIEPDTAVCMGDTFQLNVIAQFGTAPYTYIWSPTYGLSDSTIGNPYCFPPFTVTYFVTVTDSNGCVETASILVTVFTQPVAQFVTELSASCEGILAKFINQSQNADTYLWQFGGGETSTEEHASHVYPYNTQLEATLIAYNNNGCSDTAFYTDDVLSFEDYYQIVVPNVFTPNGDGQNDWFEIEFRNKLQECTNLKIYNRWGELMFESSGNNHSWDGRTFAGEEVPAGTFFFIFSIREAKFNGSVTLLR